MKAPLSHVPVFHAYVNFAADTAFDYTTATEITADIEAMDITGRGKNLLKQQAEAACLTMLLNNTTQKYTPSYTGSPIYPNLLPGKQLWVLMGYPADQWYGMTNNATLAGRKPDHDSTFAAWSGDTSHWKYIAADVGVEPTGVSALPVLLDFGECCCHVGAKIKAPSNWSTAGFTPGVVFRYLDANNYWIAVPEGGMVVVVKKMVAGAVASVDSVNFTWAAGSSHWLTVEMAAGDQIRVSIDDTAVMPTIVDTFNDTVTLHGIGVLPSSATVGGTIIEFGGYRPEFKGRADTWTPNLDPTKNQCTMVAYDDMERQYMFPVMQKAPSAPTTAGDIINLILSTLNPTDTVYNRCIDEGNTLLISDAAGQERLLVRDALTEIHQVEGDDVGFYWIDGNGLPHYESYMFRITLPQTRIWFASRQNSNESDIFFFYQNSTYDDGKDRVWNDLLYNYYFISTALTPTPVWNLNNAYDKPAIGSKQTITLCARGADDQIANPVTPVGTTDFTVNTAPDGSGTDITSSCTATLLSGPSAYAGNSVIVTLYNNSVLTGYVTFFQLRAYTQVNSTLVTGARASDAASIAAYGLRRLTWDTLHIADFDTAQAQATRLLDLRKLRLAHWTFLMTNATQSNLMQIIHRTISERIKVIHTPITLNSDFNIERWSLHIPHSGGSYMECTWELQAATSQSPGPLGWLYRKKFTPAEMEATTGTIEALNSSTIVTGAGYPATKFLSWNVGDMILLPDNKWYTIYSISSDTYLTLTATYTGADTSGATYKMMRFNYTMPLTVYRTTGSSSDPNVVFVGSHCNSDYSDLRFTLDDGASFLSYWIEKTSVTNSQATVWVKIPQIISDNSVSYYMYYGNTLATTTGVGADTFDFFDDFNGSSLDTGKWVAFGSATPTIAGSLLKVWYEYSQATVGSKSQYGPCHRFRWYGRSISDDASLDKWQMGASSTSDNGAETSQYAYFRSDYYIDGGYWRNRRFWNTFNVSDYRYTSPNTYTAMQVLEIKYRNGAAEFWENNEPMINITTDVPSLPLGLTFSGEEEGIFSYNLGWACYIDWCFVCFVAPTEPTYGIWGSEE